MEENIRCPITGQIYRHPVIIEDGNTYEKCVIEKYLEKNNISPMTRELLESKKMISNRIAITLIEEIIKVNPKIEEERYERYNYNDIYTEIKGGDYRNILKCEIFDSEKIFKIKNIEILLKNEKYEKYGEYILTHLNNYNIKKMKSI